MKFADLYARTLWRRPFRVCGESLLPLTVGHCRILESLDLWSPDTWMDLMICAWICGKPPGEFRHPRGWREAMAWRVRLWRLGSQSLPDHCLVWKNYVEHHMETPVVTWQGKGSTSGTPTFAALRIALIRMGYSPDQVDDAPVDQALLDHYGMLEAEGRVTVSQRSKADLEEQFQAARRHVQSLGKN